MPFQSEKQRRYLHANHPEIANRWEAKYGLGGIAELNQELNSFPAYYLPKNQGGRIGFDSGTNYKTRKELIEEADLEISPSLLDYLSEKSTVGSDKYNIKFSPEAELSLSKFSEGDYDVNLKNIMYGGTTTANLGPVEIGMDITNYLDKYDVTEDDVTVEKDTRKDEQLAFSLGIDLDTLYARIDSDKDFKEFYLTIIKTFGGPKNLNQGGVVPAHEAGIYGLAEGGQLVQPGPGRPGYNGQGDYTPDRSTGGGGPPGGGDPGMTYTAPTVSTTAASEDIGAVDTIAELTSTRDDGPQRNVHFDTPEILEEQRKLDLQQMVRDQSEKTETWEQAQQWNKPNKFVSFIKNAALAIIPGLLPAKLATGWKFGQGLYNYKQGNYDKYLPAQFKSTGELATHITNTVAENAEKRKTEKAEQDLIQSLPRGHPERIQLEELKKETITTERDNGQIQETGTSITIDAEEVNDAKTQLLRKYQEMNDASRLAWLRQQEMRQAYLRNFRRMYMSAQGGRVPQGYNTGGLSNLFKLKNV